MHPRTSTRLVPGHPKSRTRAAAIFAGLVLAIGAGSTYTASAETGPHTDADTSKPQRVQLSQADTRGGPPSDSSCYQWGNNGYGCFEYDGDDIWVKDTDNNGYQFRVHAQTDYGRDIYCADDTAGWTQCDYNVAEDHCISWHGYHPPHASSAGRGSWTMGWSTSAMANCRYQGSH